MSCTELCLTIPWGQRRAHPWIAGLVLGLATLVRPQNILFGILPLGIAIRKLMERKRNPVSTNLVSTFRPLAIIGIATVGLVVCQAAVYYLLHGSVTNIPYLQSGETAGYGQSFNWMNPQILSVLFSGFHGLVSWHPLVGLSLLGLALAHGRGGRLQTPLRWILLLAFALQLYLISAWWSWWQGASFGGRMFSSCSAIFVLGLAALWDRWPQRSWRGLAVGLTLLAMAWNALLVMQYESAMIPPEAAVPLGELYRNQLSALPYFVNHILNR